MVQNVPTIGVVIVSYNTSALLEACLRSLRDCTLPLHIVVVDNASRDDSVTLVQSQFPEVHLHALDYNPGFAGGTNIGLRSLGFDQNSATNSPPFALLLNPDTVVHAHALEQMIAFMQDHPRVGLVGPRLLNPDSSLQRAAFRFPTLIMSLLEVFPPGEALPGRLYDSWWHGRYPQESGDEPFPVDHILGACMLARRETIDAVGLLDEDYFMYSEEIDWCWRIRHDGWAIWTIPNARITHVGGASTQQFRYRMFVELHRSRIRFFQRYYKPDFLRAHRAITRVGMVRASLGSWYAFARKRIDRETLRQQLTAYGEAALF